MELRLSRGAQTALDRLSSNGYEAYIVGGSVRDTLMGKQPDDFDITTSALPDETKALFGGYTVFESGKTHGTVAVVIAGEIVEITTFRRDGEYFDHRHPVGVTFTRELADDLSRRDFTVNAMAWSEKTGIVDIFGGRNDLERGIIRCVGESGRRFEEDALRILRALRFSSVLGFDIHPDTARAVNEKRELLCFVSRERIAVELKKLIAGKNAGAVISGYKSVFEVLFGSFEIDVNALSRLSGELARLAVFFEKCPEAFATLKPSKRERSMLNSVLSLAGGRFPQTLAEMKRDAASSSLEALEASLDIRGARGEDISLQRQYFDKIASGAFCSSVSELAIGGRDLMSLGVPPCERIGYILGALFEAVLNGDVENTHEALIAEAEKLI